MKGAAVASEPTAEEAALRVLKQAGTAADALIAAFLAAAAERASVLFAPLQIMVAGPGVGPRAFDGRCRQPGLGVPRPRGVMQVEAAPVAARVAAPSSLGALSLLHAHDAGLSFEKLAVPAAQRARALGALRREAVLSRLGRLGPSMLRDSHIARPLLAIAGPAEGGLLTARDLAAVRPEAAPPEKTVLGGKFIALSVPWSSRHVPSRNAEIIAVVDARGVLGVLAYSPDDAGVAIPDLELTLPRDAAVVRRGIPRTRPGEPLDCAAPIALLTTDRRAFLALGVAADRDFPVDAFTEADADVALGALTLVNAARRAYGGRPVFAVARPLGSGDATRFVLKEEMR